MRITLPSGAPAEVALSPDAPTMGLVIAPDIFGLRPLYDSLVARFATEWGMAVCAVEPFPGLDLPPDIEPRVASVPNIDDEVHLRNLHEAADHLAMAGVSRIALLGFCLGGMYCHKASRSDRFERIVSFYGMIRVPEAWRSPTQGEPLQYLGSGHAERVLAIVGDLDHYTPAADVEALEATGVTVVRYANAEHGFAHDVSRPAHRAADAADAFGRAQAWFAS
jgi:dienelactone hydrolase